MDQFHSDKPRYFEMQYLNSKNSIIPFIQKHFSIKNGTKVLEIGCAEAGVLKAFTELGCICTGIELQASRVENAKKFMAEEIEKGLLSLSSSNIYNIDISTLPYKFDIIILKDVIEHIHDQKKFMAILQDFLADEGVVFFGFPSWRMPYGGHQQLANNKILAKTPYYHLLPKPVYKTILKGLGETSSKVEGLLEIKETGISTLRFEKLAKLNHYTILEREKYLIAPIYEYKFGYKTKKLPKAISSIPYINDFFTFQSYYLIKKNS